MSHPISKQHGTRSLVSRAPMALIGFLVLLICTSCLWNQFGTHHPQVVAARLVINDLLDQADIAEAGGDPVAAQNLRDQAAALECADFGCEPPQGTMTIEMDPTLAGGFFSAPWPSDTRLAGDGSLDLTGFPGRATLPLADLVLTTGEAATFGFGTNSAVFFEASGPLSLMNMPIWAEASVKTRSTAMLVNLDDPTGAPLPLLADYKGPAGVLHPADLLTLLPHPGHPLEPSTRYGAIVFDELRDTDGNRLVPAPIIDQLDGPAPVGVDPAVWAQLRIDRDDVIAAVRARTLWHPSELVAFTTFTTQDPTAEMAAVAAAVDALPAPISPVSRTPFPSGCTPGTTVTSSGLVALPLWQQGTPPFTTTGGGVVIGGGGLAVQQGVQLGNGGLGVELDLAIPCGPAPAAGWPILLFVDGTGAGAVATGISELGSDLPYAVLSIAPLYSGDRFTPLPFPFDTEGFQFFNYLNPVAGRTNIIQQAADVLYLRRIAEDLILDPAEADGGVDHLDADTIVMAGHSQGSTSLPLTLAFDPTVDGAFLSAPGAGLYHSVIHREDVRVLVDTLLGTPPDELDMFHPYPQLIQTFAEPGDAANYGSLITADVAMYAGLQDGCSSIEVGVHLAQAMGVPIANQVTTAPLFGPGFPGLPGVFESVFEPEMITLPVSQNLPGGRTAVMVEVDAGHFGASSYPAIGRSFVDSIAAGGPPTVDPGPTPPVAPGTSCPRFDPAPAG